MFIKKLVWWLRLQHMRFVYHSLYRRVRLSSIRKNDLSLNISHASLEKREIA